MHNLEQIRAKNAYAVSVNMQIKGKQGGQVVKKLPPLIINHGLLAVLAYALDSSDGYQTVFDELAKHLADSQIRHLPEKYEKSCVGLLKYLASEADSKQLKLCTSEALAWFNYARRLVKREV